MKKIVSIIVIVASIFALSYFVVELNKKQIISALIFTTFILSTLLYWRFRLSFAFLGIVCLLITGVLDVEHLMEFANFDIILFLIGMMTAVGFLEKKRFFEYLMGKMLRYFWGNARALVMAMMLMSGLFGALVDEVTSILFMTSIILHLVSRYKLRPVPFVLMIVFATNIGSSATVVGNPIGVLIAFRGGLTFMDFLRWATPISLIVIFVATIVCIIYFSKDIAQLQEIMKADYSPHDVREIQRKDINTSWIFAMITMPSLIFHKLIEQAFGLETNTMLLGAAFLGAGLALLIEWKEAKIIFARSVDWWTLCFFALFFASVGTLKYVGTIDIIGKGMIGLADGSNTLLFFMFTGATAALTPIVDNVLVVAVFIPIVDNVASLGYHDFPIWWGMLFSGTLFGNLTMIGSTANIVAVGMLEARGYEITLKKWIKPGLVVSVITLIIAIIMVFIQIPLMPQR